MEVLIIGAGIAGLACARALRAGGASVRVVDRGRKVGGRCATRRLAGQGVDYGPSFFHATEPELIALLESIPASGGPALMRGWPERVVGSGVPCHADSFRPRVERFSLADGMNALPAFLAQGQNVALETHVEHLTIEGEAFALHGAFGRRDAPATVVITAPPPQAERMLERLEAPPMRTVRAMFDMVSMAPCLTSLVLLPLEGTDPGFDLKLPADSEVVHNIAHDSAKRHHPAHRALVVQAQPKWSAARLDQPKDVWGAELLSAAAKVCRLLSGPTVEVFHHRWTFARLDGAPTPSAPLLLELEGGLRLGVAGEAFDHSGGIEGAWRSGTRMARRLLEERK